MKCVCASQIHSAKYLAEFYTLITISHSFTTQTFFPSEASLKQAFSNVNYFMKVIVHYTISCPKKMKNIIIKSLQQLRDFSIPHYGIINQIKVQLTNKRTKQSTKHSQSEIPH